MRVSFLISIIVSVFSISHILSVCCCTKVNPVNASFIRSDGEHAWLNNASMCEPCLVVAKRVFLLIIGIREQCYDSSSYGSET